MRIDTYVCQIKQGNMLVKTAVQAGNYHLARKLLESLYGRGNVVGTPILQK
jgi:hypothetical protein